MLGDENEATKCIVSMHGTAVTLQSMLVHLARRGYHFGGAGLGKLCPISSGPIPG